ncbi:hypothetical protein [Hwanghaeella sp.]|uniref:hypothetical protein n=1 Tax=Hwanghaeella sp. TaxID=2605943 RepID=UPI003CCC18AB
MTAGRIVLVLAVALAIRALYVLVVYLQFGADGLMGPDSHAFIQAAQYLADGGSYMQVAVASGPGIGLDLMPVPFLVMSWTLSAGMPPDPLGYVLLQIPVDAATCVIAGMLAERLRPGSFLIAGLIGAFNPTQIVVAGLFYTDTLFLFFVAAGLLTTVIWLERRDAKSTGAMGIAWGLALVTRPFVQHWLMLSPLILLLLALLRNRTAWLRSALGLAATLLLCVAIASPVMLRNQEAFGSARLHAQTGAHLLFWVAPLIREYETGIPIEQTETEWRAELLQTPAHRAAQNPFQESDAMTALAGEKLKELGIPAVLSAWVKGAVLNLASPASTISPLLSELPRQGFYDTPGDSLADKVWNFLFDNEGALYTALLLISAAPIPVALLLACLGFAVCLRGGRATAIPAVLLFLWAGYTLGLNGPVFSPKYRLPLEPVWVVMTAIGLMVCLEHYLPSFRWPGTNR